MSLPRDPSTSDAKQVHPPRSRRTLAVLGVLALMVIACLLALGTWQVERLAWKRDLIARVEARLAAAPVEAPSADIWSAIDAGRDEYRKVSISGTFLHAHETLANAVTELGPGFWVMTPLQRDDGSIVFINRGFVPGDRRDPATRSAGQIAGVTQVTGLMRMNEPGGSLLQSNVPTDKRWYSRDVTAMAAAADLGTVAPYFIDADATPNPGGLPVGGLTRIQFPNNHLVYAITWYALALMLTGGCVYVARLERRRHRV